MFEAGNFEIENRAFEALNWVEIVSCFAGLGFTHSLGVRGHRKGGGVFLLDTQGSDQKLGAGTIVAGRYSIVSPLGSGGMGAVYLAADKMLGGEKVAIKILHTNFVNDQTQLARFMREVQLMRKVNHKNVVRTYDVGSDGPFTYFTMEYVPGVQLEKFILNQSLPLDHVVNYMMQICEALHAIHAAGIIHRDLKPANIIVLEDGTLRITDFGVARTEISNLTAHDEIVGSVCYIAPEIWLGKKITSSVDLYSLGVILYEMLTGDVPFDGETPAELMRAHLDRAPTPPKEIKRATPQWLNKLALRLLGKSPKDRPHDAKEVLDYLKLHSGESAAETQSEAQPFFAELETKSRELTGETDAGNGFSESGTQLSIVRRTVAPRGKTEHRLPSAARPRFGTLRSFATRLIQTSALAAVTIFLLQTLQFVFNRFFPEFLAMLPHSQLVDHSDQLGALGFSSIIGLLTVQTILLLLHLSVPAQFIGGATGSNTQALRSMVLAFMLLGAGFIILAAYFMLAAPTKEHFTALSLLSAAATAYDQISSAAFLSPAINVYEQIVLGNGLIQSATGAEPLFHSTIALLITGAYIAIISYWIHRLAHELTGMKSALPALAFVTLLCIVTAEGAALKNFVLVPWSAEGLLLLRSSADTLVFGAMHWLLVFAFAFAATNRPTRRRNPTHYR